MQVRGVGGRWGSCVNVFGQLVFPMRGILRIVRAIVKARQVLAGLGVVALGVCAALPFQHSSDNRPRGASAGPTAMALRVRGADVPEAAISVALPPIDKSAKRAEGDTAGAADSGSSFPALPRLTRTPQLPELAASFAEATGPVPDVAPDVAPAISAFRPSPPAPSAVQATAAPRVQPSLANVPERVQLGVPVFSELPSAKRAMQGTPLGSVSLQGAPQPDAPRATRRKHRIRDGDTLPALARRYLGDSRLASRIFEANRDVLSHPDVLPLGISIVIP